jgi:hypothetical protein
VEGGSSFFRSQHSMRMNFKSSFGTLVCAITLLGLSPRVFSQTWIGDNFIDPYAQGNAYYWNDVQNWDTAVPVNSSAVVFDNNGINRVVNLFSDPASGLPNAVAGSISFGTAGPNSPTLGYTIGSSGQSLTVGGGGTGNVAKSATVAQAINANLFITGSGRTISNTAAGSFSFGGSISTLSNATLTLTNAAAGGGISTAAVSTGTGLLTVNNASANNVTLSGTLTSNGLTVGNTGAGNVNVNGAVSRGAGSLSITNSGAGSVTFGSGANVTGTGGLSVTNGSTGSVTFNGSVATGGDLTVSNTSSSGVVSFNAALSGATSIAVSGAGRVRLGDATADAIGGSVTIGSGSRLDGVGTINGALTLNGGTYLPGVGAIGTQTIGGGLTAGAAALTVNTGSAFEFDLNSTLSDVINLSGRNLDLIANGSDITVRLNLLSAINPPVGDPGTISWNVFTGVGNASTLDLSRLTVDSVVGNVTGTAFSQNQFFWSVTGGNTLTLSAVPEPSSMALVGLVGVGAAGLARRRMKKAAKKQAA